MPRKSLVQDHNLNKTNLILITFHRYGSMEESYSITISYVPRPCEAPLSHGCRVNCLDVNANIFLHVCKFLVRSI